MRPYSCKPRVLLPLAASLITACNAPTGDTPPTLAFTEQDLRQTAEAIVAGTSAVVTDPTPTPDEVEGIISVWPTLLPTTSANAFDYRTMPGDTLDAVADRFGVALLMIEMEGVPSPAPYLQSGLRLSIPRGLNQTSSAQRLLPDAEMVHSPTAAGFDLPAYIESAAGFLRNYSEVVEEQDELTGAQIVQRVADQLSVNPRLLLALLEYRSGWVLDQPLGAERNRYPLGYRIPGRSGLYEELKIAATQLNLAYYGWRDGSFTSLRYEDETTLRLDPTLNAGTVALMHLFATLSDRPTWEDDLYSPYGFSVLYFNLFGDPWGRAGDLGDLIPHDLAQPNLELPFLPGEGWSLTAGPHYAWNTGTPLGALDFSPITVAEPCEESFVWVTASADGVVVRARDNVVALDLDGDGEESSGWVLVYFHIATKDMIPEGVDLAVDQRIGHPSCEGGTASGTHVHLARKYNGEWIPADGPVPLTLSGWRVVTGERIYQGQLIKGDEVVTADPAGRAGSTIIR